MLVGYVGEMEPTIFMCFGTAKLSISTGLKFMNINRIFLICLSFDLCDQISVCDIPVENLNCADKKLLYILLAASKKELDGSNLNYQQLNTG